MHHCYKLLHEQQATGTKTEEGTENTFSFTTGNRARVSKPKHGGQLVEGRENSGDCNFDCGNVPKRKGKAMLKVGKSDPTKPARVMIYSEEGVGKTTFCAKSDKPIFVGNEDGFDQVTDAHGQPVSFLEGITTWTDLRDGVKSLIKEDHDFKTVAVDSADWIEGLCHAHIIGTSGRDIIRVNGGYGAGYRESQKLHADLIKDLSILRDKKKMNIIVTAHAHVRPVKDPSMLEDYDSFEIKCHPFVSSLWREWVDALLFARFTTFVKANDGTKARALSDGSRTIYTTKQPSFQAKSRYKLPEQMNFTENFWNEFYAIARQGVAPATPEDVKKEITTLSTLVKDRDMLVKINKGVADAGGDLTKLLGIKNRLVEVTGQHAQQ